MNSNKYSYNKDYPLVVVLGLSPTGLYAVRELARAGFQILGVTHESSCATASNYLSHPDRFWQINDDRKLLERLIDVGSTEIRRPILLPTSDRYIEFLVDNFMALTKVFIVQNSYDPDFVFDLLEKGRFYKLCAEHAVPAPGIWHPESRDDLMSLAETIPFPCILKPKLIHLAVEFLRGKKVLLANNRDEFLSMTKILPEDVGGWLVQEVIPGPESNIFLLAGYFNNNSEPVEIFTARKLRQYPPGFGSASLVESEMNTEIKNASVTFLRKIGFKGVCGTEFKYDPRDGRLKIIEINPRPTLWFHLSHAAGKRVVETACRDMIGLPVESSPPQKNGVLWRYVLKDFYSELYYFLKGKSFVFPTPEIPANPGKNGRCWAVYDPDDPRPAWSEPINYLRKLFSRI